MMMGALALLAVSAQAKDLYVLDFANGEQCKPNPAREWKIAADGKSIRYASASWGMVGFSLGRLPKLDGEFRISFDVREFGVADPNDDYHWGMNFTYGCGNRGHFHSRGQGFQFINSSAEGKSLPGGAGGEHRLDRKAEDPAWTHVTLDVRKSSFAIRMDGETCVQKAIALAPIASWGFYAWRVDAEFANFRIETLPPLDVKRIEKPTFTLGATEPASATGAEWVPGLRGGQALHLRAARWGETRTVAYDFREPPVSSAFGGVSCWVKYANDAPIVRFLDADGKTLGDLRIRGDYPFGFHAALEDGKHTLTFRRRIGNEALRTGSGEWVQLAFSWREDGSFRFYMNGLPYPTGCLHGQVSDDLILGNVLGRTRRIAFESTSPNQDVTVQDLKLFRRPLTNREVELDYRRTMPLDFILVDDYLPAGRAAKLKVCAAPGGTFTRPKPVRGERNLRATVDVDVRVERCERKDPWHFAFTPVEGGASSVRALKVSAPTDVEIGPMTLGVGQYRVVATFGNGYRRVLPFRVCEPAEAASSGESDERWTKGALVWEHAFGDPYREAGDRGGLEGDRYGCVVPFREEDLGRPCLITFAWPDDKTRVMGLYMFRETPDLKARNHRDRLQGGLVAGDIYRTTGRMQTSEFLFYPSTTSHWFEVRTFVDNAPGALAKMSVHRLETPWPKLKLNLPEGVPGRTFGFTDEDQTFDTNLNADFLKRDYLAITKTLLEYFDYTGQNSFHYGISRYDAGLGPVEGVVDNGGMYPYSRAANMESVRRLAGHGVEYVGEIYMDELPEVKYAHLIDGDRSDWIMLDKEGNRLRGANFAKEEVSRAYVDHFIDEAARLAACGMRKVRLELMTMSCFGSWPSLDAGYDDANFADFRAATGLAFANLPAKAAGVADYRRRFETLTGAAYRAKWLKWRAEAVTRHVARVAERLRAVAPGTEVLVEIPSDPSPEQLYEQRGVDLAALAGVEGVRLGLCRSPTSEWWHEFRRFVKKGDAKARNWEAYFSLTNAVAARIRELQGSAAVAVFHNNYFETFRASLGGKRFGAYFESMDPKPWGRNFLREFAWALAVGDVQSVVIGDQPLGTLGNEDEAREFARAFRALPAVPFGDLPGVAAACPGVVARSAKTSAGEYVYVVNTTGDEVSAPLGLGPLVDLSSGRPADGATVALRPYELRSFLKGN